MCAYTPNKGFSNIHIYKGFTLMELLVVMVIIGISLGAIGIAVGTVVNDKQLSNQAARFIHWLDHNRDIALVRSATFLVVPAEENIANRFQILSHFNGEWEEASIEQGSFKMPDSIQASWELTDISQNNDGTDELLGLSLFPDNTYTPFTMVMEHDNGDRIYIDGDGFHSPEFTKEDDS